MRANEKVSEEGVTELEKGGRRGERVQESEEGVQGAVWKEKGRERKVREGSGEGENGRTGMESG